MFFIIFGLIGAALGYSAAPRVRANPMVGAGIGALGGLIGGALVKILFPIMIGLIGAAIGALILLYAYREFSKR